MAKEKPLSASRLSEEKPPYASGFSEVLEDELKLIRQRRAEILHEELGRQGKAVEKSGDVPTPSEGADWDARLTEARLHALDEHLTGISFSGGGIRSGTFAVGLLQGLSSLGLLRRFDYLSTVSGGGYAGGWLASWLKRDGDVRNVERQLAPAGSGRGRPIAIASTPCAAMFIPRQRNPSEGRSWTRSPSRFTTSGRTAATWPPNLGC